MAQKTLNAFVVIGGRVDNSFGQIGTALISMGQTVDEISQKLINFGKESIEVYRGYEDSMLDAQVALSTTYGRGSRELASVMKTLDAQATEWAASTIFHTDDVANAIAQAAHANWDLDMILTGIPNAMRLAQAGGMDLSEAVDFIVKSVNGAGLEFQDLTSFIDEWTFAANSSAGDVEEFGEAMLKMGNTMQFAGSKEELFTMLAILHDTGTTGAAAGTLLRNTMLRLIAPTKKAKEAMEELGITQDDLDEAMSEVDGDTAAAVARLEELGFSVYDDTGNLKGFLEIFRDLDLVTQNMSDEDKYAIWSAIFPTRTITGGMALIQEAEDRIKGLFAWLNGGEAEGYGEYAAETMMGGLTGSIETFNSKVERLKQVTGEELSDDVMYWTDKLGQFVDKIATLDDANFSGLVGGLEVIAGAGPGLIIAGTAFRFLGFALGTHAGRIALAAIAIGALTKAVNDYNEAKFAENFGTMDLDTEPLIEQLNGIDQKFNDSTATITAFRDALNDSVDKYNAAAQTFSSKLLTDMITGNELTDDDLEAYRTYGEQMIGAVKEGIQASADMSAEYWAWLFKGASDQGDEYAENPIFQGLIQLIREDYDENLAEVEAIGEDLRGAITSAFDNDGKIDEEEYEKIKNYFRQLNEAMARAKQEAENEAEMAAIRADIDKAQNLSYDAMMDYLNNDLYPRRQAKLDEIEQTAKQEAYARQIQYERDYAAANTPEEKAAVSQHYNELLGGEYAKDGVLSMEWMQPFVDAKLAEVYSRYDPQIMRMTQSSLHEGDLSQADALIEHLVNSVLSGAMSEADARSVLQSSQYAQTPGWTGFGTGFWGLGINTEGSQAKQTADYYKQQIAALGGREAIESRIGLYSSAGMEEYASNLSTLLAKYDFYNGTSNQALYDKVFWWRAGADAGRSYSIEPEKAEGQGETTPTFELPAPSDFYQSEQVTPTIGLQLDENGEPVMHAQPAAPSPYTIPLVIEGAEEAAGTAYEEAQEALDSQGGVTIEATTEQEPGAGLSPEEISEWHNYIVGGTVESTMTIEGAEAAASEAHADAQGALDAQGDVTIGTTTQQEPGVTLPAPGELMQIYSVSVEGAGEAASGARSEMEATIEPPIDSFITFPNAGSSASSARSTIEGYFSNPITQHVQVVTHNTSLPGMATGGRATEPVVYGEAGPEWFIPERHDKNTANLIAMAAHASGFSLAELATMGGARMFADGGTVGGTLPSLGSLVWAEMDYPDADSGQSSGGGNSYDVHYAPVIHAENAEGVDKALKDDKARLKKLLREIEEERELIGSVVRY